jgi:hypothetical protein
MREALEANVSDSNFSFSQPIELRVAELITGAVRTCRSDCSGTDLDN